MIDDTFRKIQTRIEESESIPDQRKTELLALLAKLKSEVTDVSRTDLDHARSIAGFTEISLHEATRKQPRPQLLRVALDGLASSVTGFEQAHPKLVDLINRISITLSNLGV